MASIDSPRGPIPGIRFDEKQQKLMKTVCEFALKASNEMGEVITNGQDSPRGVNHNFEAAIKDAGLEEAWNKLELNLIPIRDKKGNGTAAELGAKIANERASSGLKGAAITVGQSLGYNTKSADTTAGKLLSLAEELEKNNSVYNDNELKQLHLKIEDTLESYRKETSNKVKTQEKADKYISRLEIFEKYFQAITGRTDGEIEAVLDMTHVNQESIIDARAERKAQIKALAEGDIKENAEEINTFEFNQSSTKQSLEKEMSRFQLHTYDDIKILLKKCKESKHPDKTQLFLDKINAEVAPVLTSEMDALEFLSMKLCYLDLKVGDKLNLNIAKNTSPSDMSYANSYTVTDLVNVDGINCTIFEPEEGQADCAPLVVFRGTSPGKGDVTANERGVGTGIAADLDANGVGYQEFQTNLTAPNETNLKTKVEELAKKYPNSQIVVMGHSLGGAMASRLVCESEQDIQDKMQLRTYQSPAIDSNTAQKYKGDGENVMHSVTMGDLVTQGGGSAHVKGKTLYRKGDGMGYGARHTDPLGTMEALKGDPPQSFGGSAVKERGVYASEAGRRVAGALFGNYVPT